MDLEFVNSLAERDVVKTSRFTGLMSKGSCSAVKRTSGDTKHSVDAIKEISYNYLDQTSDLALELKGASLAETVRNNYDFLYSHFQYKADPKLQQMRSPNCSWNDRFSGIDCKSYTIFAITLLLNQGYKAIIRRVKQPSFNSDSWTHVYAVVPKDQTNLDLKKGYYVIDATLHENKECSFVEKHDTIMSKLPHVWLNGAAVAQQRSAGDNSEMQLSADQFTAYLQTLADRGVSGSLISEMAQMLNSAFQSGRIPDVWLDQTSVTIDGKKFVVGFQAQLGLNGIFDEGGVFDSGMFTGAFDDIFGGSLSCINGTYHKGDVEVTANGLREGNSALYTEFNTAVRNQNLMQILIAANNLLRQNAAVHKKAQRTASKNWSSSCSKSSTKKIEQISKYYLDLANKVLLPYMEKYFKITLVPATTFNSDYDFELRIGGDGLKKDEFVSGEANYQKIKTLSWEEGVDQIPQLEFNAYALESVQSDNFDVRQVLNNLSEIVIDFTGGGSVDNNNGSGDGVVSDGEVSDGGSNVSQAGIGVVPMVVIGGFAATALYNYIKNKKK